MSRNYSATHLDIPSFSQAKAQLEGEQAISLFERLALECQGEAVRPQVHWSAFGEQRADAAGEPECWLHLQAQATLPRVCQRCLQTAQVELTVNRSFRFVLNEEIAEQQDEQCEEDLLVTRQDFNLIELIEDELLMEIPIIAKHEICPESVKARSKDPDFADPASQTQHPFAVLSRLRDNKSS